jgi:hypothetical protein
MEVAVDDGDWVDGDARQDAHLDRVIAHRKPFPPNSNL